MPSSVLRPLSPLLTIFCFFHRLGKLQNHPAVSISSSFDFFSVHSILIILLMYHFLLLQVFFRGLLLVSGFTSMQKDEPDAGFQSVNFGAKSDISVEKDGFHIDECVFRQSYTFLYFCVASGVWICCEAQVFKGVNLFYSFPLA